MAYAIRFKPSALRELRALPKAVQVRVAARLDALSADPRLPGVKKLAGDEEFYRVRLGDYRIVFAIDDAARLVLVVKVGHRGDVYRSR